jgi:hypothetical protein
MQHVPMICPAVPATFAVAVDVHRRHRPVDNNRLAPIPSVLPVKRTTIVVDPISIATFMESIVPMDDEMKMNEK